MAFFAKGTRDFLFQIYQIKTALHILITFNNHAYKQSLTYIDIERNY